MQIRADTQVCIGAGLCVLTAPAFFDQDDDGVVTLLSAHLDRRNATQVLRAVGLCPSRALSVSEE